MTKRRASATGATAAGSAARIAAGSAAAGGTAGTTARGEAPSWLLLFLFHLYAVLLWRVVLRNYGIDGGEAVEPLVMHLAQEELRCFHHHQQRCILQQCLAMLQCLPGSGACLTSL